MQRTPHKALVGSGLVAFGLMVPVGFAPGAQAVTVTSVCAQNAEPDVAASCRTRLDWDCVIGDIVRENKCDAADAVCNEGA